MNKITYTQAVNDAITVAMTMDEHVICYGLGVPDPRGVFGTTIGLQERFGKERVFDTPISENAMTGIGIGASLNGIRPVMVHQRLDFFLLAMDQLVNNAANWHFMFGGQSSVPITIRLIIGRGWGQGPTHSQSLQSWFAHIPGLKVVMPTTARDAKGLLLESIFDDNPVVFLEHRWLHNQIDHVPPGDFRIPLGKASLLREGDDVTVVSMSYMSIEALHAVDYLKSNYGICCDLIDLRSIKPIDWELIYTSVKKTGKLLALDTGKEICSVGSEIISRCSRELFSSLLVPPSLISLPDCPTPTSLSLTKGYYKRADDIAKVISEMMGKNVDISELKVIRGDKFDVPGDWFKGPF